MNRIADLFILNILWIFCSLPIVTIGAATTALYSINLKILNKEEESLIKTFFKAFKENFKKSTIIWLFILIISIVLGFNLIFWLKCGLSLSYFALPFIFFSLLIFFISNSIYISNTNKNKIFYIKYCFVIALKNLPYSLLITIFGASVAFATFYYPIIFLFMVLLGISLHSYMVSRIFLIVFNKDISLFKTIYILFSFLF
ncbi:YesL family protein [uncultured Clostridium sp.]|uniref:YesL family protein n=1 Tax=uncultured Clostridium sp. TaxID=59620 RepID=UPI0034234043